jgi:hypothetical protein
MKCEQQCVKAAQVTIQVLGITKIPLRILVATFSFPLLKA